MIKTVITSFLLIVTYGCMPGYTWINNDFTSDKMTDNFYFDKGNCIRESDLIYQDPNPVQDPEELSNECMANTTRRETYPVKSEDGSIKHRTVTTRGNSYLCRPSRELRNAYREYEYELRQQQSNRAKYVNACLSIMGWERIKTE
ncbi:MAG: hypothetical protein ACI9XC_000926 [Gammaproteobacteria bacterium]|jgi:hypothetical protein